MASNIINISKPSTLYVSFPDQPPKTFKVFHKDHGLYYFRQVKNLIRIKFNLPAVGSYSFNAPLNIIKIVPIEIPANMPTLPEYDREFPTGIKEIKIVDNPNLNSPARIYTKQGVIEKGKSFYSFIKPIRAFFLLHEFGHLFYGVNGKDIDRANEIAKTDMNAAKLYVKQCQLRGEKKCDLYAFIKFLEMGYNRSTAFYALKIVLKRSQENVNRIKSMAANIQQTQNKSIYA